MLPALITVTSNGETTTGSVGLVAKTFLRGGRVIGGEVLVIGKGYELQVTE
jgi:hypothetical protein